MKQQPVRIITTLQEEFFCGSRQQPGSSCGSGEEGAIDSIPGNEGRIAQAWVNVRGGLRVFSVCFWHSEGWSSGNEALLEAVLKRARTTKHPWLTVCDANMSPEDFEKTFGFGKIVCT